MNREQRDRYADRTAETAPTTTSYPKRWFYAEAIYEDRPGHLVVDRRYCDSRQNVDEAVRAFRSRFSDYERFQVESFECVTWSKDQRALETSLAEDRVSHGVGVQRAMGEVMARFGRRAKAIRDAS